MADLLELDAKALGITAFLDAADLQGDEPGFGILEKPVRRFSPLQPSLDNPSACYVDESQGNRLRSILRDPMPVVLLQVPRQGSSPV
jgi:hypothetical protein